MTGSDPARVREVADVVSHHTDRPLQSESIERLLAGKGFGQEATLILAPDLVPTDQEWAVVDVVRDPDRALGVLILVATSTGRFTTVGWRAGKVDGVLFLDETIPHLDDVIALAESGHTAWPRQLLPPRPVGWRHTRIAHLTRDEVAALGLLASGFTDEQIAERLGCTPGRARTIVRSILRKMQFRNRTEAAVYIWRNRETLD